MSTELIRITLPDVTQEVTLAGDWFQKRDQAIAEANGFTDANAANADDIGQAISKMGKMASKIEAERKKLTAPYLAAQKAIKAVVDKATEPIDAETGRLKAMLAEFAENERRRLADEEAKRLLARLAAEAEEEERRQAEEELFGSSVAVTNVVVEAPAPTAPKFDGVRLSEAVTFDLLDDAVIPVTFMTFDPAKLRAWIAERKEALLDQLKSENFKQPITGIVLKIESKVAIR